MHLRGMKKTATCKAREKRPGDELRAEYSFDYSKARPNRFAEQRGLGTEIAELFSNVGLKSDIPELRGQKVKPAKFTLRSKKGRGRRPRSS